MPPVLVIQQIIVEWDKSSRGGAEAERRNALPEAAKVPFQQYQAADVTFLQQTLAFPAYRNYTPPSEEIMLRPMFNPVSLGGVTIIWNEEQVKAKFRWSHGCGAPDRGWMAKTLSLAVNEWGQIVYNGRLSDCDDGQWYYHKTVVNVGLFAPASNNVFTRSEPNQRYSAMAHLY